MGCFLFALKVACYSMQSGKCLLCILGCYCPLLSKGWFVWLPQRHGRFVSMNYYTTKEISEILGLSIKTIQKLIRTRQLKAFKVGGRFIVEENTLKDYINARQV